WCTGSPIRVHRAGTNRSSEPIREVLESDESDVIPYWALDSLESARCGNPNTRCLGPQWLTLPERSDRCRMGGRGAHDPACPPWWAQTIGQRARGAERDFLHPMDRVSVEGVAQRPAAEEHGARLSGTVELGRKRVSVPQAYPE